MTSCGAIPISASATARCSARRRRASASSAAAGRPFLATLISASNHHPFRTLEPALDVAGQETPQQRILNTTRYTDDVLRELIEGLRGEPWFARTLIVIIGDHGYNLGEHGGAPGGYTLYRELVWVPMLIVGPHPRLPAGRHDEMVTILDLAPTFADLIGLREANPWQGHSLLGVGPTADPFRLPRFSAGRAGRLDRRHRPYRRPAAPLCAGRLAPAPRPPPQHPELARRLLDAAELQRRFNDYLVRHDRVWPRR